MQRKFELSLCLVCSVDGVNDQFTIDKFGIATCDWHKRRAHSIKITEK